MTDPTALCDELTATWHREIPIVASMGMAVERYDGQSLTVRAPLQPNRNVHGTTFAGSLYSACVLTGWGAIWLALRERGLAVLYLRSREHHPIPQRRRMATSSAAARSNPPRFDAGLESIRSVWPRELRARLHDRQRRQDGRDVHRQIRRAREARLTRGFHELERAVVDHAQRDVEDDREADIGDPVEARQAAAR